MNWVRQFVIIRVFSAIYVKIPFKHSGKKKNTFMKYKIIQHNWNNEAFAFLISDCFYEHVKAAQPISRNAADSKSYWHSVMKIWNLGLLLQALSKIGFLCIQSHFHVWVTQINPISNQKEASSQPPPNPCPDPDSCGLLTSPQGRSCKWTSAVVPLVGQWRAEPRGVACKLWANTWVVCKDEFI